MKEVFIPAEEEWHEICMAFKNRKQGRGEGNKMILIQSQLHACSTDAIKYILLKNGYGVEGMRSEWLKEKCEAEGINLKLTTGKENAEKAAEKQQASPQQTDIPQQQAPTQQQAFPQQQAEKPRPMYSMKVVTKSVLNTIKEKMETLEGELEDIDVLIEDLRSQITAQQDEKEDIKREYAELEEFFKANEKYL